ncbi:MAG: hypothetical protein ACT4TC_05530 [Myxococcaceae bacterium]
MSCPHASTCALYAQFQVQSIAKYWILQYCDSAEYSRCARYKLASVGQHVPLALLPSGKMLPTGVTK